MSAVVDQNKANAFDEDMVLVDRFIAGDGQAFETLYARYYDRVSAIARGVLADAEDAHDAVQEIFTLVYRHLKRFNRRSRFSTWLFRVAVNRSIQEARKNRHKSKQVELNEAYGQEAPAVAQETDPKIYAALGKLPPQDRALLVLFYWEQLSLQDISDSLGCNVNAAKTRLYRAREKFRQVYEGESS